MEPITIFVLGMIVLFIILIIKEAWKIICDEQRDKDNYVKNLFESTNGHLEGIMEGMKQKSMERKELEEEIKTTQSEIEELTDSRNFIEENMDEEEEFESEDYYGTMEEVNDIDEQIGILEEELQEQKAKLEKMNGGDYE